MNETIGRLQRQAEQQTEELAHGLKTASPLQAHASTPPSPQSRVANLVATGYIGEVDVSTTQFYITIDSRLAGKTGATKRNVGSLEVVDQRFIHWNLLDAKDAEQLRKLRNSVSFGQRKFIIQTAWGPYIPAPLFSTWLGWVQECNRSLREFEQQAIEHIQGREQVKLDEFKRDFCKLFSKVKRTDVDKLVKGVKSKFQALVKGQVVRQSVVRPRGQSARGVAFPAYLPDELDPNLREFARTITSEVNLYDLAGFATAATRCARNFAATSLKLGSEKKTILETLARLEK